MISGQGLGLLAAAIGAVIALGGQQAIRALRRSGPRGRLLKEECVQLLLLSEDLQRRITASQNGAASEDENVRSWDADAYRRARARLQNLSPPTPIQSALADLDETRADLKIAWRLSAAQTAASSGDLPSALGAYAEAIEHFATSSAVLARVSWSSFQHPEAALSASLQVAVPRVHLVCALASCLPQRVKDGVKQNERQLFKERSGVLARCLTGTVCLHRSGNREHMRGHPRQRRRHVRGDGGKNGTALRGHLRRVQCAVRRP